ncbi:hypothetical protein BDZ45DRAFT_800706 [Acephala macrosclerotiorum]|nr:hypothetical protein BDZ45DRAFT_800706 [Acephala macrosclerotiorum]
MLLLASGTSTLLAFTLAATASSTPLTRRGPDDEFAKIALDNVYKVLNGTLSDGSARTTCTKANVAVRKEYGDLTIVERDDYVKSVKCLMNTTSKLDLKSYPRAKSRYDDFVVVHMNMTPYWNWGKYADPTMSPFFNGDAHSVGGNGESVKHTGSNLGMAFIKVPAGKGGDSARTGPFRRYHG